MGVTSANEGRRRVTNHSVANGTQEGPANWSVSSAADNHEIGVRVFGLFEDRLGWIPNHYPRRGIKSSIGELLGGSSCVVFGSRHQHVLDAVPELLLAREPIRNRRNCDRGYLKPCSDRPDPKGCSGRIRNPASHQSPPVFANVRFLLALVEQRARMMASCAAGRNWCFRAVPISTKFVVPYR